MKMARTGRPKATITLSDAGRAELERFASPSKIILASASGTSDVEVAGKLRTSAQTVGVWRKRFIITWTIAGSGMLMLAFVFQTLSRRKPDIDAGVHAYANSHWASTSVSGTAFWDNQSSTFNTLKLGGSISESIGQRPSFSANVRWGGDWPNGGDFNQAVIATLGTSYNLGAGLRAAGSYEPHNDLFDDDFGGFVAYPLLPFAEINLSAGRTEFIGVRLMMSYALERQ